MLSLAVLILAAACVPFALWFAIRRPLIFPFGLYVALVPFDNILGASGATLTRAVGIMAAAVLLLHVVISRQALAPPRSWGAWALLVGWMALSALWTIDGNATFVVLGQFVQLFLFYTLTAIYPIRKGEIHDVVGVIIASGLGGALYGLVLYATGARYESRLAITNASGSLWVDPNHFAASLLLPIALAVATLLVSRNFAVRAACFMATAIMSGGILLSGSRGALLALGLVLAYIAWRTRHRLQILLLGCIAVAISLAVPTVWVRFADPKQAAGAGRLYIWEVGYRAFHDYWFAGAGLGTFATAYDNVFLSMYQHVYQGWSRPSHNIMVGTAVELGVIGLVLMLRGWWLSWIDARTIAERSPLAIAIEASIVGLLFASLFIDTLTFKYVWLALSVTAMAKNVTNPRFLRGARRRVRRTTLNAPSFEIPKVTA